METLTNKGKRNRAIFYKYLDTNYPEAKQQFIKNKRRWSDFNMKSNFIKGLNNGNYLIFHAFYWINTPQGYNYWSNIAIKSEIDNPIPLIK